jgi:hypothetical protein
VRHYLKIAFIILFATQIIWGCKKKKNTTSDITALKGKVTLTVKVLHHQYPLANQKVYLKLATTSYPSNNTSLYNYSTSTNTAGEATFSQLPMGDVWLYSNGYDPTVGRDVAGNAGYIISSSSVDANYNASVDLFVSE